MSFVSVRNITRRAGDKAVLRGVSLDVDAGEVLAVLGPNGAGKTSLLRVINMLDRPDAGEVLIDGHNVWAADPLEARRSMAMVFQKPLPFSMSVYDNVAYGLRLRRARRSDIDEAVKGALKLLDMAGKERQYARSLSGGETQRLAFARAYVLKPRLLLLDEPTASLDPANAAIIESSILDVNRRFGTTIIMVTHNFHQAKRLAGRSAFMMDGEVVETGPSRDVLERPRDPRTARFISGDLGC